MPFRPTAWLVPGWLVFASLFMPPARANAIYRIDQLLATIGFSVNTFGVFETAGQFKRFDATLSLDFKAPENSQVDVTIDAGSVTMSYQNAVDMLLSPDFFDVSRYPSITFHSTSVHPVSAGQFDLTGNLTMRGISRPATLKAILTSRSLDAVSGEEISDFAVSGDLDRTSYGMDAQRDIVAKTIHLDIRVRLRIDAASRAG